MSALVAWDALNALSGRLSGSSRGVLRTVSGRSSGIACVCVCVVCRVSCVVRRASCAVRRASCVVCRV
eukprot:6171521-Alexandrium_andersonii.AAC.1